ncbi:hypothetical protein AB0N09_43595 [Streptomyces erythrochromogenes]|uniref:hypothetical protein n=1 Tax=Streptomyces erythrochromogenes TaxID=285574 RepID=UPI0034380CD7
MTRFAATSPDMQELVAHIMPQAVDPNAHTAPGFVHTIYTQTELDAAVEGQKDLGELLFTPGTGSELTITHGDKYPRFCGPGTLTAVTGGTLIAYGEITKVTGGHVTADGHAVITEVTGGEVTADGNVTVAHVAGGVVTAGHDAVIIEVTGGDVTAEGKVKITTVTDGVVFATGEAVITDVAGGNVTVHGKATATVTAGAVTALKRATVTVIGSGKVTIIAKDRAHVHIPAGTDAVVHAYDAAQITAESGRIVMRSAQVNVINNGNATIVDNRNVTDPGSCAIS